MFPSNSIGLKLTVVTAALLLQLRFAKTEHCMVYEADVYVLKQCGYGMPKMIGCLISNQTVYLDEQKIIGEFMYGCRRANWQKFKIEMIESYITGCVFQEQLLKINETVNLAHYEMKCSELEAGAGMVVSACIVNDERLGVGERRQIANRTEIWCRNRNGSISVENTACLKNGVVVPKGERFKEGRYEYVCKENGGSLTLDHEYCHYGIEQMAKVDQRYVHEGTEYICFNTGLEPKVYATGCIHEEEVVPVGKTVIINGFLSACQKGDHYSKAELHAIGCYRGNKLIPIEKKQIVGLVQYHCRKLATNVAQLVSVACLTHDGGTVAIYENATIGAFRWMCRPDEQAGSLHPELVQTACVFGDTVILPNQLYNSTYHQFKCVDVVNEGKLKIKPVGCLYNGVFTPFGQDMTVDGKLYLCEDQSQPEIVDASESSVEESKSEEISPEIIVVMGGSSENSDDEPKSREISPEIAADVDGGSEKSDDEPKSNEISHEIATDMVGSSEKSDDEPKSMEISPEIAADVDGNSENSEDELKSREISPEIAADMVGSSEKSDDEPKSMEISPEIAADVDGNSENSEDEPKSREISPEIAEDVDGNSENSEDELKSSEISPEIAADVDGNSENSEDEPKFREISPEIAADVDGSSEKSDDELKSGEISPEIVADVDENVK